MGALGEVGRGRVVYARIVEIAWLEGAMFLEKM